ncbi:hypothetical protein PAHAL_5G056400 [Panicum hallii]|uniref:Uncharacterized protein n=1 Tax=Panicum hallii TaxID=206008 RepID=A0A2T8IJ21_9POAL|nr:hypothetical protein PAHAL_5G056400 [Panicum hallii]
MDLRSSSGPPLLLPLHFSSVPFPATLPPAPPLSPSSLCPVASLATPAWPRSPIPITSHVLLRISQYLRPSGGRALVWRGDAQLAGGWLKQNVTGRTPARVPSSSMSTGCESQPLTAADSLFSVLHLARRRCLVVLCSSDSQTLLTLLC